MRPVTRKTPSVATVLFADLVVVGDLAELMTVVDDRRAFEVAANGVLVEALGNLEEPIGERCLVGDQVPKRFTAPVRVDGPRERRLLPLVEHP